MFRAFSAGEGLSSVVRMLIPVVLAAALMNAAMVAASAVSTILIADDLSPALAGLPNTAGVLGTAAGAMAVGRWTAHFGRAHALRTGYGVGVAGGALTVLAAVGAPVALLFVGMFLLGVGNAASLLSRYAAADVVPASRRAWAMSTVIWASTAGAAGGPFLMAPSQSFATVSRPTCGRRTLPARRGRRLLRTRRVDVHPRPVTPHRAGPRPARTVRAVSSYVGGLGRRRDDRRASGDGRADDCCACACSSARRQSRRARSDAVGSHPRDVRPVSADWLVDRPLRVHGR